IASSTIILAPHKQISGSTPTVLRRSSAHASQYSPSRYHSRVACEPATLFGNIHSRIIVTAELVRLVIHNKVSKMIEF
ncbi:MAG: hypothetical protein WCL28_07905, partial [bacterium]